MRVSPLRSLLEQKGCSFEQRCGVEICASSTGRRDEYRAVREAVGITDFSFMQKFRIPEETAIDFLDELVAGNVAKVRFGRILHTFLADADGMLVADCYVANNDEEFILLCESLVDDTALRAILDSNGAGDAKLEDLAESHVVINIDGYKAWAVVKELFGADVLGLPYLSIEVYPFDSTDIRLFRAGKTSEFGYSLMAPREIADKLFSAVLEAAQKQEGGLCGVGIHNDLRLEGRFFNIFAEGARIKDPLALGLQWMIDFDKDAFVGRDAIMSRREAGSAQKIIGVRVDGDCDEFAPEAALFDEESEVARLVATCRSDILDAKIGLAMFPSRIAYSGLPFNLGSSSGKEVRTISMPPIMPKSLTVKLDEL
jgi:aminomethyltransferase